MCWKTCMLGSNSINLRKIDVTGLMMIGNPLELVASDTCTKYKTGNSTQEQDFVKIVHHVGQHIKSFNC